MQSLFPVDRQFNISFCFPFQMVYMSGVQSIKAIKTEHVLAVVQFDTDSQIGDALQEALPDFHIHLSAVSVIGTQKPGVLVYSLAAKQLGKQVENPHKNMPTKIKF